MNKRYFYLQFFRTALISKQTIASPLSKDHRVTYHQGEASLSYKQSLKVHIFPNPVTYLALSYI